MQPWMLGLLGSSGPIGEAVYTTPGVYTFVVPGGVTSVCAVAVGPGAYGGTGTPDDGGIGGRGGSLGWKNDIPVTPGQSLSVVVGSSNNSNDSYFISALTVMGRAGATLAGGSRWVGDGGGNGGSGGFNYAFGGGGGGAGGYSGNGGAGGFTSGVPGGGGGGGGGCLGAGGGGVGLYGQGSSGGGSTEITRAGRGGSGGNNGEQASGGYGGLFGGGGGGAAKTSSGTQGGGIGGDGAVRIIWGEGRSFPYNAA